MNNCKLQIGVDELTLVLQANPEAISQVINIDTWPEIAEEMITKFVEKGYFKEIFGEQLSLKTNPKGYTIGYKFGDHPYYFAIAYHDDFPKMGVICKFSAYAWTEYCRLFQQLFLKEIHTYNFLQNIQQEIYTSRLSRIDFFVDYFDFGLSVNSIYRNLTSEPKQIVIRDYRGWSNFSKLSAIENDKVVSTFYVGSKRANVNTLLRVYDKKLEQIQTYGFRLNKAQECKDWVRFEAVFKGKYAHQLTELLLNNINQDNEYQSLIASKILEKFTFYDSTTEEMTDFSIELAKLVNNEYAALSSNKTKDNTLMRSIDYITQNSGLNPTLYKINSIWGERAVIYFFRYLYNYYSSAYEPNVDTLSWIKKFDDSLSHMSFDDYLKQPDLKGDEISEKK